MLELLLILGLLIGVPVLAIAVLTGSAAYVEAEAERELEAMAEADTRDGETDRAGDPQPSDSERPAGPDEG